MKAYWMFTAVGLGALLAQGAVSAHHSFAAEFDRSQKVTITGSVTKVEWENPHARFYVDAKDEGSGEIVNWDFELASPNGLMRRGWTRNSITVTLASGKKLFAGSSAETEAPPGGAAPPSN